jgi:predicted membrane protein
MDNDIKEQKPPHNGKATAGLILLAVGCILLLKQFDFVLIPDNIVLWPLWLVAWGLFVGAKSNFHKPSSFVLLGIGIILFIGKNIPHGDGFIWPVMIIGFGLWMILRRRTSMDGEYWEKRYGHKWDWRSHTDQQIKNTSGPVSDTTYTEVPPKSTSSYPPTGDDYLDAVSVFGGIKKTILSKDFKGGEIVNVFGGAELDFTQADITGRVVIDITQIFGGTKIIVPSHWQVVSDIAAVFAGFDDKRMRTTASPNGDKILVLKGVSIFAGVDIRSF